MKACLTKFGSSLPDGFSSYGSTGPVSETAYFKRVYGSDHLKQLHDGFQMQAIYRYALNEHKRVDLVKIHNRLSHLTCENDPEMTAPGRSAYSLKQLKSNLDGYCKKQCRSLRWNQHYQAALASVANDVRKLLKGRTLQPMSIGAVAASEQVRRNVDKNAGYFAFETGKRSKGENLDEAVEWCLSNLSVIKETGCYGLPLVISHRSSNSKPTSKTTWKWRCRIILMQDVRALLLDGRFAIPFTELFKYISWGEGGMTQDEVRYWVQKARDRYQYFYSSDYSKFDISQADWLLEDVFQRVVRPCFGKLSDDDEALFKAMMNSYIHKEIHGFDGIRKVHGCQVSGALTTYAYNTIINEIIDRTVLLMQGCDLSQFHSLKCGDDNLTYYKADQPWNASKHCELIKKFFGIETRLTEADQGKASKNPIFLSKEWCRSGERRSIDEVVFNLIYPERFRNYDEKVTGVSLERAVALVLMAACLEQKLTMQEWFDIDAIARAAGVRRNDLRSTYQALANMGSGFRTPWLHWKQGLLKTA